MYFNYFNSNRPARSGFFYFLRFFSFSPAACALAIAIAVFLLSPKCVFAQSSLNPGTLACASGNGSLLRDIVGVALPGAPVVRCADGQRPSAVVVQGVAVTLFADGAGPSPITKYGGIRRECGKLLPNATSCFSTNPFEAPLLQTDICGYASTAAYILACDSANCAAETFAPACAGSSPDLPGQHAYTAPASPLNVAGHITSNSDFESQSFASRFDFTENFNIAARIVAQGRTPILGLGSILIGADGAMLPTAARDLAQARGNYPSVFNAAGLAIVVYDEPFLRVDPATLPVWIEGLRQAIALVHALVPAAALGVTVAPVWNSDPRMIGAIEAILPGLHWLATDVYAFSLDAESLSDTLGLARQFADYMKSNHPNLGRWLIIQGFAPVSSPLPSQWSAQQSGAFKTFLLDMIHLAATQYDGAMVWGWSNAAELDDAYSGKFFPLEVKQLYLSKSLGN